MKFPFSLHADRAFMAVSIAVQKPPFSLDNSFEASVPRGI